jgi:hypothetical protein
MDRRNQILAQIALLRNNPPSADGSWARTRWHARGLATTVTSSAFGVADDTFVDRQEFAGPLRPFGDPGVVDVLGAAIYREQSG